MRLVLIAAAAAISLTPSAAGALSPERALGTVSVSVNGNGTVTSNPPGISCPSTCSAQFPNTVELTASPGAGASFAGWGGACAGNTGNQCRLGTSSDHSVAATFASVAPSPTLSLGDISVTEGDAGTADVTLSATVSPPTSDTVTAHYATSDGSATSASDFVSTAGTLTFTGGASTATLTVPIRGDTLHEASETFFVDLSSPDHAVIGDGRGVVTIVDNDPDDLDGDGFPPPQDCDDANASIHPGRTEIPGNAVDENCDGTAAPFPTMDVGVETSWQVLGGFTRVVKLDALRVPAGSSVNVRCSGLTKTGCPFKSKTIPVPKAARIKLAGFFAGRKLRPGTVLDLRITKPSLIGKDFAFAIRRGKLPTRKTLCLPPGARSPVAC